MTLGAMVQHPRLLCKAVGTMKATHQPVFTVDDLPRFSPWPARLLGMTQWAPRKKTPAEITREFDHDKWGTLLDRYLRTGDNATLEIVEGWAHDWTRATLCSIGERFELLAPRESLHRHYQLVADTLHRLLPATCIVELGAGYGGAVLRLATDGRFTGRPLYAAEYTSSGRELLERLAKATGVSVQIGRCDLSKAPVCDLQPPDGGIVFTCMAAHYVPELDDSFVGGFRQLRATTIVHFEPCYEHFDPLSLTGALRRRYVEVNDYNRNLISLLRRHAASGSIVILEEAVAVIGVNPLLPISIVAWQYKDRSL